MTMQPRLQVMAALRQELAVRCLRRTSHHSKFPGLTARPFCLGILRLPGRFLMKQCSLPAVRLKRYAPVLANGECGGQRRVRI